MEKGKRSDFLLNISVLIILILVPSVYSITNPQTFYDGDEPEILSYAQFNSYQTIIKFPLQPNPPLFFIALKFISAASFGNILFIRLLLGIIFSSSLIVIYFLVKNYFSNISAYYTSGLLLSSPLLISHIGEISNYGLFLLFSMLSLYYTFRLIHSESKKNWFYFLLFSLLNFHTHYFAFVLVSIEFAVLFFQKPRKNNIFIGLSIIFIISLTSLSFALNSYTYHSSLSWTKESSYIQNLGSSFYSLAGGPTSFTRLRMTIIIPLLLFSICSLKKRNEKIVLWVFLLGSLFIFLVSFMFIVRSRYYIFLVPLVFILISSQLNKFSLKNIFNKGLIIFLILFISGLFVYVPSKFDSYNRSIFYENNIIEPLRNGSVTAAIVLTYSEEDYYIIKYYFPDKHIYWANGVNENDIFDYCSTGCKIAFTYNNFCDANLTSLNNFVASFNDNCLENTSLDYDYKKNGIKEVYFHNIN